LRIADREGRPLGSGFAVRGAVLTCAHVVGHRPADDLMAGSFRVAAVRISEVHDVALLEIDGDVDGLPVAWTRPDEVMLAGFPLEPGLTGALFGTGRVSGRGAIGYEAHARSYQLPEAWALAEAFVSPGDSGGPVVDRASGAVVGITVANFSSVTGLSGPSGFALPLSALVDDQVIGGVLRQAEDLTPRYGPHPNAPAALAWCREATRAEVERMSRERLLDRQRTVGRPRLQEELVRFLEGDAAVWAVVDRSGLGKSTAFATMAAEIADRPTLFIRAMEVDAATGSLNDLVASKLREVRVAFADGVPDLAAMAQSGPAPLVIVDGLNESQLSPTAMRDVWLPNALRDAEGCKLVITCRPEAWTDLRSRVPKGAFHGQGGGGDNSVGFQIGEFSDDEREAFVDLRFSRRPGGTEHVRNPLLLGIAAELREELDGARLSRWRLFEEWIRRDCGRAASRAGEAVEVVEGTLERVATTCLRQSVRSVARSNPVTREPGFSELVREHLLVSEGSRIGFRYDSLFEHLVARSIDVSRLEVEGRRWRHEGREIAWPIIVATCERIAAEDDTVGIAAMWELLDRAEDRTASNLLDCVCALPVPKDGEERVLAMFERAGSRGLWGFSLSPSVVDVEWRGEFSIKALRIAVRAASGYDFRENDLSTPMRFARSEGQFEFHGFKAFVESLLASDRLLLLDALCAWHTDGTRLGEIWGDSSRESTIWSWTSCCFVFCHASFTDEELLTAPSPAHAGSVFQGLTLADPERLLRLANQLAGNTALPERRFREALFALRSMAEEVGEDLRHRYARASMELGLKRVAELEGHDLANQIVAWCAAATDLREEAWRRLLALVDAGRAETSALRAFLTHKPAEVMDLASSRPEAFATEDGSIMLDLARSPMFPTGAVSDESAALRMGILADVISSQGFSKRLGGVIEGLLYEFSPEQAQRVGVVDLALEAIRAGAGSELIVYFAGDQNAVLAGGRLAHADLLARAFARECPDLQLVEDILSLRLLRAARAGEEVGDVLVDVIEAGIERLGVECVVHEIVKVRMFFDRSAGRWKAILACIAREVGKPAFADAVEGLMLATDDDDGGS
jgi:hypothetical protein